MTNFNNEAVVHPVYRHLHFASYSLLSLYQAGHDARFLAHLVRAFAEQIHR